jgi:hypothetical protein
MAYEAMFATRYDKAASSRGMTPCRWLLGRCSFPKNVRLATEEEIETTMLRFSRYKALTRPRRCPRLPHTTPSIGTKVWSGCPMTQASRACKGSALMNDLKDRRARRSLALLVTIPTLDTMAESLLATSERRGRTNRKDFTPTIAGELVWEVLPSSLCVKAIALCWLGKNYIYICSCALRMRQVCSVGL